MTQNKLHLALFDGSLRPPSFVFRLAEALAQLHNVYLLGFSGIPRKSTAPIHYLNCGSADRPFRLLLTSIRWALQAFIQKGKIQPLAQVLSKSFKKDLKGLQRQNLKWALTLTNPDLIHVQWPSLLPWCEPYLESGEFPMVLSQRGYQTNVRPWMSPENLRYLQQWYPKIDGFHSVSKAISKVGNRIYSHPDKIEAVVYSGFDMNLFEKVVPKEKMKPLQIISIGRPHWKKGYPIALRAMKLWKDSGAVFQYTIVGAKEEEELLFLIKQLKLSDRVSLLGKLSQEEVYQKIADADVLVLPSLEEGLPNVVIEAMLLGTPVVATQCGGVGELVDETTGFLVEPGNPQSLFEGLQRFAEATDEVLQHKTHEALQRARKQHHLEQMVVGMQELYDRVLARKS